MASVLQFCGGALAALTVASNAGAEIRYQVIDLGVALFQGVDHSVPVVTDNGLIAGVDTFPSTRGYVWNNGSVSFVPPGVPGTYSYAYGINSAGTVVGMTPGPVLGTTASRPYIYSNGTLTYLPDLALAPSVNVRAAYAINDAGTVVGEWERTPFVYANGTMQALPFFRDAVGNIGAGGAVALNDNGWIAGYVSLPGSLAALVWHDGQVFNLGTLPLGPGWRPEATAQAINNQNDVVGASRTTLPNGFTVTHGYLWNDGVMTDLGTLRGPDWASSALSINDLGHVVGQSNCVVGNCAFLWNASEGMLNLNSLIDPASGWLLDSATGINDRGWIVGNGRLLGQARDYLLLPVQGVPEPSTAALAALGLAMLGARRSGVRRAAGWVWRKR